MLSVKEGDRVILRTADSEPSAIIPLWGSKYGCVGTALGNSKVSTMVQWDNGEETGFFLYKLELFKDIAGPKDDDPNLAFLHKKREGIFR
ncbi:MAG: hypothetical protein E3J23_01990 [Candidatus Stahlbacteria bacterium]|nr:MAG: hypothetical protein E3J23_01990 [Candidatus Stahlbacteria bacterium]